MRGRTASDSRRRSVRSRPSPGCWSVTGRFPAIVDSGHQRALDLAIELPEGELEAVASAEQMSDVLDRIAALVLEHRTTLVFVNTRRLAERLAHQLGERLGDDVVAAHHGSLSKDRRYRVESRSARGRSQGARRHRVARARHRHRAGGARVPDRIAPQHRDVPAACGPIEPLPRRRTEGPPLPVDSRRARRVRGAARRRTRGPSGRDPPAAAPARHPRPADRGRGRREGVGHRRALRDAAARGAVHRADPRAVRRSARARRNRRRHRSWSTRPLCAP